MPAIIPEQMESDNPFSGRPWMMGLMGDNGGGPNWQDGLSIGDFGSVEAAQAFLTRQQYQQFLDLYKPAQDKMVQLYDDRGALNRNIDEAQALTRQAFENSQQSMNDTLRSQGVTLTPEQQAAVDRRRNLGMGGALADSANRATRSYDKYRDLILSGGVF